MKYILVIYLLLCCCAINAQSGFGTSSLLVRTVGVDTCRDLRLKTKNHRDTICTHIHFRQGYSQLDLAFADNKVRLQRLVELLDSVASDPLVSIKSVIIKGTASPEGGASLNHRLSERRAQSARAYILAHTSLKDSIVRIEPSDVDWKMLNELVAVTDRPWRDKVLDIITNTPLWIFKGKKIIGGRTHQLQMLQGGACVERNVEEHFSGYA